MEKEMHNMAEITAEEFVSEVGRGVALFLDINPPDIYSKGHPAGTYNFPYHRRNWGRDVKRALNGQTPPIGLFGNDTAMSSHLGSAPFDPNQILKSWVVGPH